MSRGACAVGRITVKDPQLWDAYRNRVPQTLAPWGGEVLLRGQLSQRLAGHEPHQDIVVIRFPDMAAARGWFASPPYQALIALRSEAADVVLSIYEL